MALTVTTPHTAWSGSFEETIPRYAQAINGPKEIIFQRVRDYEIEALGFNREVGRVASGKIPFSRSRFGLLTDGATMQKTLGTSRSARGTVDTCFPVRAQVRCDA